MNIISTGCEIQLKFNVLTGGSGGGNGSGGSRRSAGENGGAANGAGGVRTFSAVPEWHIEEHCDAGGEAIKWGRPRQVHFWIFFSMLVSKQYI